MVNNMKALIWLFFTRFKANLRHIFSKPSSAIITCIIILTYGGLFIGMLANPKISFSLGSITTLNTTVLVGLGTTFLMISIILLQKRKALFMESDAFYLFSGPFKRSQIMKFLMSQTIVSALICGAISLFMMVVLGQSLEMPFSFLFLAFICFSLIYYFFTTLYYYVYLLSIKDDKYKHIPVIVIILLTVFVLGIYMIPLTQHNFNFQAAGMDFINSKIFYAVPFFGWTKMFLISYMEHEVLWMLVGLGVLGASCYAIYAAMCRYQGDFVEKAMQDAEEFTALYKEARAGKRASMSDKKIRNVQSKFKEGAAAIYTKNMLIMRKTNTFIQISDVIVIGCYLAITLFMGLDFSFFMYMMMFWLFSVVQNSDFMRDMNNYQIYLIPDKPFKKLLYVMSSIFIKLFIQLSVVMILCIFIFSLQLQTAIQYYVTLLGYLCVFLSGTVLSLRLLKSRNNKFMENLLRMFIIIAAAIPGSVLIGILAMSQALTMQWLAVISILSLCMNIVISLLIVYACRSMMNGRELKSE